MKTRDIFIRGVPEEAIESLKAKAAKEGSTLSDVLRVVIIQSARPSRKDLFEEMQQLKKKWGIDDGPFQDSASLIREMRQERMDHIESLLTNGKD